MPIHNNWTNASQMTDNHPAEHNALTDAINAVGGSNVTLGTLQTFTADKIWSSGGAATADAIGIGIGRAKTTGISAGAGTGQSPLNTPVVSDKFQVYSGLTGTVNK